jgi:adenosylcobinamide kinase/adenosylcobinamide-phosphate guanylyltransferase
VSEGKRLILILGGARGGKSIFAEELAAELGREVLFVATAEALDESMRVRIAAHQASRPAHWRLAESPRQVASAIEANSDGVEVVLLDCLTLLATNVLLSHPSEDPQSDGTYPAVLDAMRSELEALVAWHAQADAHLVVVTNEVGMGVVPPYSLGRAYRDLLGWANRWLALRADEVYLMVAGLPVDVKALARVKVDDRIGGDSTATLR